MIKIFRFIRITLFPSNGTSATCFISFGCVALLCRCCICCCCRCMLSCIAKKRIWATAKVYVCVIVKICDDYACGFCQYFNVSTVTVIEQHTMKKFSLSSQMKFICYRCRKRLSFFNRVQKANFISINFFSSK